jgi:two-component system nitrogen regulation response regulator NtrX
MSAEAKRILVVDDEKNILRALRGILEDEGYQVIEAQNGAEAQRQIAATPPPDLVLLDIWLPDTDGVILLQSMKSTHPSIPVVMMSGHGTIELAVRSTKLGAYDFIEKPLSMEKTILTVAHALSEETLEQENRGLRSILEENYRMIGESKAITSLKSQIDMAAPSNGRVLLQGENGTGKELVARLIHLKSRRVGKNFVTVNCAAIPEDLIESELFGHEKGSFTGAYFRKQGTFESADGGSIFLDEVADMSLRTQAKVLRVLEEQSFQRVGGTKPIVVDTRVIAATNKDLTVEIHEGRFREDLYFRLNVIPFSIPALRDRREDIPLLIDHFVRMFVAGQGLPMKEISPEAMQRLTAYAWPGNVRELKNIVERLLIMAPGNVIRLEDIPPSIQGIVVEDRVETQALVSLKQARQDFERRYILEVLEQSGGNISRTAQLLGIERSNLHRKLRQLKLHPST